MHRLGRLLVLSLALIGLGACHKTNTTIPYAWRDSSFDDARFSKLFVIGVGEDERLRRVFEDRFVEAVSSKGATAEASWLRFLQSELRTEEQIREAIGGADFDGVLVTRLLSIDEKREYLRPSTYSIPTSSYGFTYSGYYGTSYTRVSGSGHYETRTMYRIETTLYAASTGELVWTGQSDTRGQDTLDDVIGLMTAAVATELKREKLIP